MKVFIICVFFVTAALADEKALREFTTANNLFAVSAYREFLKNNNGNFFISPLSAEIALSLAQSGAKGETGEEMRNALHLPNNNKQVEIGVKSLLPHLKGVGNYTMHIANKLYVKENYTIKEEFKKIAADVYQSEIDNINFGQNEEAANIMNFWVEEQTNNKIHNIIDPSTLDVNTRIVIINALYFKAVWLHPFFLTATKLDFYKTAEELVKVDMMHNNDAFINYHECSELNSKMIELPFKGEDVSMTIILPNEKEGLNSLENQLDKVFIPHTFEKTHVNLQLPKFKLETKINFKNILGKLGVHKAFSDLDSDFSGMAGDKGELKIDEVVQKTFMDLNEEGIEAVGSTAVVFGVDKSLTVSINMYDTKEFLADHPFIFYIKMKNVIVFAGRVTDPNH